MLSVALGKQFILIKMLVNSTDAKNLIVSVVLSIQNNLAEMRMCENTLEIIVT